jgi:hypothetical protein
MLVHHFPSSQLTDWVYEIGYGWPTCFFCSSSKARFLLHSFHTCRQFFKTLCFLSRHHKSSWCLGCSTPIPPKITRLGSVTGRLTIFKNFPRKLQSQKCIRPGSGFPSNATLVWIFYSVTATCFGYWIKPDLVHATGCKQPILKPKMYVVPIPAGLRNLNGLYTRECHSQDS